MVGADGTLIYYEEVTYSGIADMTEYVRLVLSCAPRDSAGC